MTRTELFDAIRPFAPNRRFTTDHVTAIDTLADSFGLARVGEMRISAAGLQLIKDAEGLRLTAYQDTGDVWTIGYGSTRNVQAGLVITEALADARLVADVADAEAAVHELCPKCRQNQFDALVSFTFNLGAGQLRDSTLRKMHNAGDYAGAKAQFGRWVYDNHRELAGLVKRRRAEAEMYGRAA